MKADRLTAHFDFLDYYPDISPLKRQTTPYTKKVKSMLRIVLIVISPVKTFDAKLSTRFCWPCTIAATSAIFSVKERMQTPDVERSAFE